jgi:hypothetical protein
MKEILKDIIMILSGIIGGYLFIKIRQRIINQTKNVAEEKFQLSKFLGGMTNIISPVGWAKDIYSIFNLRKLIIVGVIIGVIFGYGYYKGQLGKPVVIDWRGKEEFVKLNEHYLHIQKDGSMQVLDKDKKTVLKEIKVKDLDSLRKYLRPYGLILEPIFVAGGGIGEKGGSMEAGAGASVLKWFKWKLDGFLTQKGVYIGTSYQITDNSGAGLGIGKGYKGDNRVILYYKWRF